MFRDRPLTWLFVVATATIDLVLMTFESEVDASSLLKLGLILGQLAALAIWSVRGNAHRLSRIACLVIGTTILTFAMRLGPDHVSVWLAFHTIYVLSIILVTCACDCLQYITQLRAKNNNTEGPWQISLIELFGWTIIVAIGSFGARHMDFEFLDRESLILIAAFLSVPSALACLIRHDLRELSAVRATIFVLVVVCSAYFFAKEMAISWIVIFSQALYVVLWMLALGMDGLRSRARDIEESLTLDLPLVEPQD